MKNVFMPTMASLAALFVSCPVNAQADVFYASAGNEWKRDNYYRTWFPVEYGPEE